MKSKFLRALSLVFVLSGFAGSVAYSVDAERPLFFTPTTNGQVDVLAGLNGAQTSIHMTMYNLTDQAIMDALVAAHNRGVEVKLLMDNANASRKQGGPFDQLVASGVDGRKSSTGFSITHAKTFIIDGNTAYVMSLNLTKISDRVRDAGLITSAPENVQFLESLFQLDWDNAANTTMNNPTSIPENFVIAPANAVDKIETLIKGAQSSILLEVENLSYDNIIQDLLDAKARGVNVQVLLPRCDMSTADFDMPAALKLHTGGIDVRLMPDPESFDTPYIHQKSIVIDGNKAFLGSENFSFNSLEKAREIGIIFNDPGQIQQMSDTFTGDFGKSLSYDQAVSATCKKNFSEDEVFAAKLAL